MVNLNSLVSVIVPIYGVELYLDNCIKSIIRQTYKNLEIILVDDGSPDRCGSICDSYAEKDIRIKVIHKENGGLSDARNTGIKIAKGDYITCIDSDDYVSNDYIEYLLYKIQENNADMSICGLIKTAKTNESKQEDHNITKEYTSEEALAVMLYACEFTTSACGKLYRKELFDGVEYPIDKYSEDMFTTYKLIVKSSKIVYGDRVCYYYLYRPGSILTGSFSLKHLDVFEALHIIRDTVLINCSKSTQRAYKSQIVSSMAELLNKKIPKEILSENNDLWIEAKKYILNVLLNQKCSKRVRMQALLMLFGKKISTMVIVKYYNLKWKKQR